MTATDHDPGPPEPPDHDDGPAPTGHTSRPPRATRTDQPTNGHRPLPDNPTTEAALLGTTLLHPDALTQAIHHGVTTTTFRTPTHQRIWHHLTQIHHDGLDPDPRLLATRLDPDDLRHLPALQAAATWPTNTPALAHELLDLEHRRRTITALTGALEAAHHGQHPDLHQLLEQTTPAGRPIEWEDVGAVLRGDYTPLARAFLERTDGEGLIYPGLLHWLFSTPGIGKTWLAIQATAEALRAGIPVAYLDWEGNRRLIGLRLQALGIDADTVDDLLHYLRPGPIDAAHGAQLGRAAQDAGVGLVIFDGFAKALTAVGANENESADVLRYLHDAVDPHTRQGDGAAVLLLDHVTKDKETRGLWPRGSGAKQGEVSGAAWLLRTRKAFNRDTPGVLELVQAKDREGEVGIDGQVVATVHLTPDPPTGRLQVRIDPPTTAQTDTGGFRPTRYMERISRHLENENRFARHPGRNELLDEVEGKKAHLTTALAVLIDEGYVEVDTTSKTHRHVSVRAYREADELPAVPDEEEL